VLAQLDPETRSYVAYLIGQGLSLEEALERAIAPAQEEAPLERQAGGPVQHFALGGLAALGTALGTGVLALKSVPAALGSGASLLGYHALTSSGRKQQEALALLPPKQKAQVKALVDQGMSVEDALEAVAQEEAPLERQAGGPVMSPQAMMPPPQGMPPQAMMAPPQAAPAGMDALMGQAPQMLSRAEGAVATRMEDVGREYVNNTLSAVDRAEDPEELINAIRGTDAPIEQRYDELAQIVGEQDAEATPPSVLTLVQPALMMTEQGAVDSGIGNLMQELSSSAEMLTGEGEATPMGEGVGNLMMAGAQPAMEALPPEAMMGPPPGAMMPPQAMMPPPPGGMAYGGPVQRFAYGGPVQHFRDGLGVEKPGFFGSIANLFRDDPGSVASVSRKKKVG
jgi:ParB-like chromosome segregation protein Spo0J